MNLLTVREVADQLSLAPKTVRRLILSGQLRGVKLGREYRVDQDELDVFVQRRTI
jgi:excisionase family DNA binding protein